MSSSLFVKYGVKAGGPSYVWGEWSPYQSVSSGTTSLIGDPVENGQEVEVQQRARSTQTYSTQLQTRTRTGTTGTSCYYNASRTFYSNADQSWGGASCTAYSWYYSCYVESWGCTIRNGQEYCPTFNCTEWARVTFSTCSFNAWTGWSNTSSCTPASPGCPSTQIECQTLVTCEFGAWSNWQTVSNCAAATPNCGQNTTQIECQSRTRSAFEE
jgi:hypothetical protein